MATAASWLAASREVGVASVVPAAGCCCVAGTLSNVAGTGVSIQSTTGDLRLLLCLLT
jgi:hypothetical protein